MVEAVEVVVVDEDELEDELWALKYAVSPIVAVLNVTVGIVDEPL